MATRGRWRKRIVAAAWLLAAWLPATAALAAGPAPGPLATGRAAFDARRYEEAKRFFAPYVAAHPREAAARHWLGRTLFALGDFEAAAEQLATAVELAPRDAESHFWLGRAYGRAALGANMLRQAGLAGDARDAYEQAVALDPGHLDARADLVQFYLMAPSFVGGSVEKAREQAAEIGRRDAARGAIARASIAMDQEDPASAIRELEEAARRTGDVRVRLALGMTLQSQQKWDAAFAVYDAILATDADHWDTLYQVGRTAALSGRQLDRGAAALRRYLGHSPGPESPPLANAHYRLGMVLEKKGDRAGAKAAYQEALRLDPKLDDAREALARVG